MKLYKNVDIKDLESILKKGLISLDESGNDNWDEGKRANNPTDKVYLFRPKNVGDSFPKYGAALIECEAVASHNEISENDKHYGEYEEYIAEYVSPDHILNIYVPDGFMPLVPDNIKEKVTPCKMTAMTYEGWNYVEASKETLTQFYETAPAYSAHEFNFFRGENSDRTMIDLYEIKYLW